MGCSAIIYNQRESISLKLSTSSIPTLKPLLRKKCCVFLPPNATILHFGTAGAIAVGTAWILSGWALQGYFAVGHCRDAVLCGWALQGHLVVRHCKDALWLATAGILCGWAFQGCSAVGLCRDTLPLSTAVTLRLEGEDNIDL